MGRIPPGGAWATLCPGTDSPFAAGPQQVRVWADQGVFPGWPGGRAGGAACPEPAGSPHPAPAAPAGPRCACSSTPGARRPAGERGHGWGQAAALPALGWAPTRVSPWGGAQALPPPAQGFVPEEPPLALLSALSFRLCCPFSGLCHPLLSSVPPARLPARLPALPAGS